MKTINQYFFAIFFFTLIIGCKKDNNLSTLPQGFTINDDFRIFNSATALSNGDVVISGILKEKNGMGLLKLDKDCKEIWSNNYFDFDYTRSQKVIKQRNDGLIIIGDLNRLQQKVF